MIINEDRRLDKNKKNISEIGGYQLCKQLSLNVNYAGKQLQDYILILKKVTDVVNPVSRLIHL